MRIPMKMALGALALVSLGCNHVAPDAPEPKAHASAQNANGWGKGMRAVYYLVDEYGHIMHVTCASPARTCFPDVVIQHPGTGMRIVQNLDEAIAGGPSKIADYFKSNDWHEAWPYLLEAENAETLGKLKSGTFIMHKQISDNGAVYYFGGPSNTEVTISSHEIALPLLPSGN